METLITYYIDPIASVKINPMWPQAHKSKIAKDANRRKVPDYTEFYEHYSLY